MCTMKSRYIFCAVMLFGVCKTMVTSSNFSRAFLESSDQSKKRQQAKNCPSSDPAVIFMQKDILYPIKNNFVVLQELKEKNLQSRQEAQKNLLLSMPKVERQQDLDLMSLLKNIEKSQQN